MSTNKTALPDGLGEEIIQNIVQMRRVPDLDTFRVDAIDGLAPNLKRGALGLVPVTGSIANRPASVKRRKPKL